MKPGRLPVGPFRSTIRTRSRGYTIKRRTSDDDTTYGNPDSEYTALNNTRDLYLYDESESVSVVPAGEQFDGGLNGYAFDSVDVQEDDRVDYGSGTYEIESIQTFVDHPDEAKTINELTLRRI